jgi:hypothetical protein
MASMRRACFASAVRPVSARNCVASKSCRLIATEAMPLTMRIDEIRMDSRPGIFGNSPGVRFRGRWYKMVIALRGHRFTCNGCDPWWDDHHCLRRTLGNNVIDDLGVRHRTGSLARFVARTGNAVRAASVGV